MSDAATTCVQECRHPQVTETARALLDAIARLIPEGETTTPVIGMRDLATAARMHRRTVWRCLAVLVDIGELRVVDGLPGRRARYTLVRLAGAGPVTAAPLPLLGAAAPRRAPARVAAPVSTNARLDFDPPIDVSERREGDQPITGIIGWAITGITGITGWAITGITGIIGWPITGITGITGWWRTSQEVLKTKRSDGEEPTIATCDPCDPPYRDRARDVVVERSEVVVDAQRARDPADEFLDWFERSYPTLHHGAVYSVVRTRDGPLVRELLQRPRTDVAYLQAMTLRLWAIESDGVVNSDPWWIAVKVTIRGIVVLHRKADFLDQEVRRTEVEDLAAYATLFREAIEPRLTRRDLETWIKPLAVVPEDERVVLCAPSEMHATYIRKNFGEALEAATQTAFSCSAEVIVRTPARAVGRGNSA